mgnify:CR=1 FL=1
MDNKYLEGLIRYAESFLGVPYVWGGNSRFSGLDCSAYCLEILRYAGLVASHEDLSAQDIYKKLSKSPHIVLSAYERSWPTGSFLFYGDHILKITHVAFAISPFTILEAGGGTRATTDIEKAKQSNACVRARGINLRADIVSACLPQYPWDA